MLEGNFAKSFYFITESEYSNQQNGIASKIVDIINLSNANYNKKTF